MNKVLVLGICFLLLSCYKLIEIPPSKVGVVTNKSGKVIDTTEVLNFGSHILKPSQKVVYFEISQQLKKIKLDVYMKDKAKMKVAFELYFRPIGKRAPALYSTYGEHYKDTLVVSRVKEILKNELPKYTSTDIISKTTLQKQLFDMVKQENNYKGLIDILDVVIKELSVNNKKIEG